MVGSREKCLAMAAMAQPWASLFPNPTCADSETSIAGPCGGGDNKRLSFVVAEAQKTTESKSHFYLERTADYCIKEHIIFFAMITSQHTHLGSHALYYHVVILILNQYSRDIEYCIVRISRTI